MQISGNVLLWKNISCIYYVASYFSPLLESNASSPILNLLLFFHVCVFRGGLGICFLATESQINSFILTNGGRYLVIICNIYCISLVLEFLRTKSHFILQKSLYLVIHQADFYLTAFLFIYPPNSVTRKGNSCTLQAGTIWITPNKCIRVL